jgi:hypothetical protein
MRGCVDQVALRRGEPPALTETLSQGKVFVRGEANDVGGRLETMSLRNASGGAILASMGSPDLTP